MLNNLCKYLSFSKSFFVLIFITTFQTGCNFRNEEQKEEQLSVNFSDDSTAQDSITNYIQGNVSFNQIASYPNSVILTGLPDHRLVTVYKVGDEKSGEYTYSDINYWKTYYDEENEIEHFMPGIEILYGYHMMNIGHYDMKTDKFNYFFSQPVLIKTLYYPSFKQDSLDNKPIIRNYYLVSVYDQDTNSDSLINRRDLRRFYHFDASSTVKTQIIPADFSVLRSQYDPKNDVMYIFAKYDANNNGTDDTKEPIHIFWISLKEPAPAKRLY